VPVLPLRGFGDEPPQGGVDDAQQHRQEDLGKVHDFLAARKHSDQHTNDDQDD